MKTVAMKSARRSTWVFVLYAAVVVVVFVAREIAPSSCVFTELLSPPRFAVFTSIAKLAPQAAGAVFAARCARRYGEGNAARRGWFLLSAWLAGWFAGQVVLVTYDRVLGVPAPVPSVGDVFFTLGCVLLIVALFTFVNAYRKSGFAAGDPRQDVLIGVVATCLLGVVGYTVLVPVAMTPAPLAERLVNVGYPVIDLLTLIPAAILLRITLGFRGGQVWRVWAAILAGIVLTASADIVFSDVSPAHVAAVGWIVDLFGALAYACCAYGTWLQFELVAE